MEKPLTVIWVFVIIALTAIFFLHWQERKALRQEISQMDAEFLATELSRRNADDCVLTQTETGYSCKEFRTGKVFNVVMK